MKKIFGIICVTILLASGSVFAVEDAEEAGKDAWVIPKVRTKGGLRYTIAVSEFENRAGYAGHRNIGSALGAMMTDVLMQTGAFVVIAETGMRNAAMQEQDMAAAGRSKQGRKTPKVGQMTPAQLLVKGVITHVEDGTSGESGGIGLFGISLGGKRGKSEINITIYLVDSQTGMVKGSKSVVGTSEQKGMAIGINMAGVSASYGKTKKDNVGKAIEAAVVQAAEFIIAQMEGIPWSGSIVMAKPGKIIINRGIREGVKIGQVFNVGNVERITDPDSGEVLDEDITIVGKIEIVKLKEKIAYCKAIEGGKLIQRKMGISLP